MITTNASAIGVKYFHDKFINWSTLRRGNVQRTHICVDTKNNALLNSQKIPQRVEANVCGAPLVHSASRKDPIFGNGELQLPKNKIAPNILTKSIIPYSASIITAHRKPEYSVWKPATNSDSASGRSNGARLLSASDAIKKITQAKNKGGIRKTFQTKNPPVELMSMTLEGIPNKYCGPS